MLLHSLYYLQSGLKLEIDHKQTMLLQQQSRKIGAFAQLKKPLRLFLSLQELLNLEGSSSQKRSIVCNNQSDSKRIKYNNKYQNKPLNYPINCLTIASSIIIGFSVFSAFHNGRIKSTSNKFK